MANSGERALALMIESCQRKEPYDVVLIDMNLPTIDGLQVAKQIRETVAIQTKPVVLLTSAAQMDYDTYLARDIQRFTAGQVLEKPIPSAQLREEIALTLGAALPDDQDFDGYQDVTYQHLRVLVAESDEMNRMVIHGQLHKLGIRADFADDGLTDPTKSDG